MHMIQYGYVPWNKPKKRAESLEKPKSLRCEASRRTKKKPWTSEAEGKRRLTQDLNGSVCSGNSYMTYYVYYMVFCPFMFCCLCCLFGPALGIQDFDF